MKAARTVTTGGMEKRVERYRALSLPTADCLQRALLRRSRFRQRLSASVRRPKLHCMPWLRNLA